MVLFRYRECARNKANLYTEWADIDLPEEEVLKALDTAAAAVEKQQKAGG